MAGRIRDEDIALVREKSPIDEIIGEHVQLRNAGGGNLKGICPFHDEKSPSLSVTPARGLYHCLAGETRVLTKSGGRPISELAGQVVTVLTEAGQWIDAPFYNFGVQPLWEITLRRSDRRKTIFATDEHRWFVASDTKGREKATECITRDLREGQLLATSFPTSRPVAYNVVPSPFGIARGITFGDGHRAHRGSFANLFRGKDVELLKWFPLSDTYERSDRITVTDLPAYFKALPDLDENASYLYGWLAGYFAVDGCVAEDGDAIISSASPANLEFVRNLCTRLGIGTFGIASQTRLGIGDRMSDIHHVRLMTEDLTPDFFLLAKHRLRFESNSNAYSRHWVVESVRPSDRVEPVYCAVVEGTHSFVLEDNILTGNCFGCQAGGDVIRFVQDIEHIDFSEAIERLAARAHVQLRYIEGGPIQSRTHGQRARLIEAHAAAAAFYSEQLSSPEAEPAREFLRARGFDQVVAARYGCGYAPSGWDALTRHLLARKFTAQELILAGLSRESGRGSLIDRFHRRLLWPIREVSGEVVGFGARRLFDDDKVEAKYLNTPETPIYKKSQLLYGVDLAKKDIARKHQAVIVEGYTDVMACHLSGVTTAVATCGTAFGTEHVSMLRRLLMDSDAFTGEVIFTFDGDSAGMKAAERAFSDDQKFMAQTFVAIEATGMDPCELRMKSGDTAVLDLVARRIPLVEFVLRATIGRFDLDTAEGRTAALDRGIPLVAQIKDRGLRDEYARRLAGLVGFSGEDDPMRVVNRVRGLVRSDDKRAGGKQAEVKAPEPDRPKVDETVVAVEREVLKVALQLPAVAGPEFDALAAEAFLIDAHRQVRQAIAAAGGTLAGLSGPAWTESIQAHLEDERVRNGVHALSVEPLRSGADGQERYAGAVLARMHEVVTGRQVAALKSKLQRINPQEQLDEHARLFGELIALESYRRNLRERAIGGF
ncbi:MAG: primase [Pseudonocardiales bacterium]|nr:primase [Pseudonocardiales bacterium]